MRSRDFDLQGRGIATAPARPSFLTGAGLLLLGLGILGLVFYLGDTAEPAAEHLYFALGLPGMAFLSLSGQVLGVVGLVVLWHWWRRRDA